MVFVGLQLHPNCRPFVLCLASCHLLWQPNCFQERERKISSFVWTVNLKQALALRRRHASNTLGRGRGQTGVPQALSNRLSSRLVISSLRHAELRPVLSAPGRRNHGPHLKPACPLLPPLPHCVSYPGLTHLPLSESPPGPLMFLNKLHYSSSTHSAAACDIFSLFCCCCCCCCPEACYFFP